MKISFRFPRDLQVALLQLASKIADGFLNECKPIGRPAGRPPKRKSLEDVTEGKGSRMVKPTPSNCSGTDDIGHRPVLRDKKRKC